MDYNTILETRRSIYTLGNKEIIPQDDIIKIIEHAVKHCPTAFNSQSSRTVVLFNENHIKLWDIVLEILKGLTPPERFPTTENKVKTSFRSGLGTILYYEDEDVTKDLQKQFPTYADNFPKWALQSNGMLENIIWNALAENNIGASLQHYNPIIDDKVAKEWGIPKNWKLLAQMPFGSIEAPAGNKDFQSIESRLKVYK
jgi:predicted oxidoreductase (fatty acid repression mutant protein)